MLLENFPLIEPTLLRAEPLIEPTLLRAEPLLRPFLDDLAVDELVCSATLLVELTALLVGSAARAFLLANRDETDPMPFLDDFAMDDLVRPRRFLDDLATDELV